MKKTFKRLGAVLLAAFMLLSTTICALAVEGADESTTSKITLNVSNVADGDTVTAYKLVSYNDNGNSYKFDESFEKYINTEKKKPDAQAYLAGLKAADVNNLLAGYATECNKKSTEYKLPTETVSNKASDDTASLEGLTPGYYLLLTTTSPNNDRIYMPLSAFVKVDGNDLAVYAGGSDTKLPEHESAYTVAAKSAGGPTIDKKTNATNGADEEQKKEWMKTATAGVGDTVRFYVQVTIPKYTDGTTLNLKVNDTLTNLEYKPNSAKVYEEKPELDATGVTGNPATIDGAIKNTADIAGNYDPTTGKQDLTFELNYGTIMQNATQDKTVYVYYEAVVKPEAVKNEKNEGTNVASLTYSNASTSESEHTTNEVTTKVFSYYLKLNKVKGETTDSLHGAEFSVYTTEKSDTPLSFVKVSDDNGKTEYYRPAVGNEASSTSAVTKIEADFQIRGLDAGTYYLEEVKTPKGYTKPKGRFRIVMTSQIDENGEYTGKLDSKNNKTYINTVNPDDTNLVYANSGADSGLMYQFSTTIKNFSTPNLPTTGGIGTVLLSIGGVVLMAAGAYLLFFRKKKEN